MRFDLNFVYILILEAVPHKKTRKGAHENLKELPLRIVPINTTVFIADSFWGSAGSTACSRRNEGILEVEELSFFFFY